MDVQSLLQSLFSLAISAAVYFFVIRAAVREGTLQALTSRAKASAAAVPAAPPVPPPPAVSEGDRPVE